MDKYDILKSVFGFERFRPGQEKIIDAVLGGRDTLAIMPTGSGKSLCYQVPALMMSGITIVISPLIALMRDQVAALRARGVSAAYINSTLNRAQLDKALQNAFNGAYKLIYVAPERLHSLKFIAGTAQGYHRGITISMVVVDEAHCISMWGNAFRPSYNAIRDFVESLPVRPVVCAFTATATRNTADDIINRLGLNKPLRYVTGFDRPNLYFDVRIADYKLDELFELVKLRRNLCGIIYCLTRPNVDELWNALCREGYRAERYHAGLSAELRDAAQRRWLDGESTIMVATNAFGMGIDKPDVRYVIHYNMPLSIEGYYQEAGRAGRDGKPSDCILLFSDADINVCRWLIEHSAMQLPPDLPAETAQAQRDRLKEIELNKLHDMVEYCGTKRCLRQYALNYFGERAKRECGYCSNCRRRRNRAVWLKW